jgi:hypothetical protein
MRTRSRTPIPLPLLAVSAVISLLALGISSPATEIANIDVVQNDAGNTYSSVTLSLEGASSDFGLPNAWTSRGDYYVEIDGDISDDYAQGVLISAIRENGRNNNSAGDTAGERFATSAVAGDQGGYFIPVHYAGGGEWNTNVAAMYFPFAEGWLAGHATNSSNNGEMTSLNATPGLSLGTDFVDESGSGGVYTVDLPGVHAQRDGVLLTCGGKNEGNFALGRANADGTYTIQGYDNGPHGVENDPVAFAFVPFGTPGAVSGRITGGGGVLNGDPGFRVRQVAQGTVRLEIDGYTPADGALLATAEGGVSWNADNILTYEADGNGWLLETRDLPNASLQSLGNEPMASFVFMPYDAPATAPGTIEPFDHTQAVSAASFEVVENGTANNSIDVNTHVLQSTGRMFVSLMDAGDQRIAINGAGPTSSDGVLLATISENDRDNSATGGYSGNAVASTYDSGGWLVSTLGADGSNPGEMNSDFSAAFFPFAQGWQAEANVATSSGDLSVTPAGVTDTRRQGLVFATPYDNNDDNFITVRASNDGSAYDLRLVDNSGGKEGGSDPVSYVYIPWGTENLVAGQVSVHDYMQNMQGEFTITHESTGRYRLSIPGKSPETGMLLLNGDFSRGDTSSDADNLLTYEADGNDFIIQGYDANGGPAGLQDTSFQFAYVDFDNPLGDPQARQFDDTRVAAAAFDVKHNDGNNNPTSISVSRAGSTDDSFVVGYGNRGDCDLKLDGVTLDTIGGVPIATIRDHRRNNAPGGGENDYGIAAASGSGVHMHVADGTAAAEHNLDFAVGFFPDAAGFETGLNATGNVTLAAGDSRTDGVLVASGYGNVANAVTVNPLADGSGWTARVMNNSSAAVSAGYNYAFLPYGTENLIAGEINTAGYMANRQGNFSIVREGNGLYRLSIEGETPDTGALLLTPTHNGWSSDNIAMYEADGDDFLIQGVDLQNNGTHGPQDTGFYFAFLKYDAPPTNPQLRSVDPSVAIGAKIEYLDGASTVATMSQVTGDASFSIPSASGGDYDLSLNGAPVDLHDGVVLVTGRQHRPDGNKPVVAGVSSRTLFGQTHSTTQDAYIHVHNAQGGAPEDNSDLAAGWFNFAGGWVGAHVGYDDNDNLQVLAGNGVSNSDLTKLANGHFELQLSGVDSRNDGILLAGHAGNGDDNVVGASPLPDGSGWDLTMRDNDGDFANFEGGAATDNFSFVYVPFDYEGLVAAARVDHDGTLLASGGDSDITVDHLAPGQYALYLDDMRWDSSNGVLLLTDSRYITDRTDDNIVNYEEMLDGGFLVQSYDLPGEGLQDSAFSFMYLATGPAMVPEPSAVLLALSGLALLLVGRRRRRR